MDLAISAVTGDLAARLISFVVNKCWDHLCSEEKAERPQQLLLRVQMVVEEADWRYISNSCMLVQLKTLSAAMYQGYHVLDNIRYMQHTESVSHSFALSPLKRARTTAGTSSSSSSHSKAFSSDLRSVLENLEAAVANTNMVKFVVFLGGCERISGRPYDAYLGVDNFMFGRHVEKQQIIGFLLRHDVPVVVELERELLLRSHFTTILHLTGDGLC